MNNKYEFREYLKQTKNLQGNLFQNSRINLFIRILETDFPEKLNNLNEQSYSLLTTEDSKYLEKLKKRCLKGGDLHQWNKNIDSMEPSSALLNYSNFLFYKGNENNLLQKEKIQKPIKTKNIILYGAPGVGKTHNYQRIISMIENGDTEREIFDTITDNKSSLHVELDSAKFQTIKDEKRVEFVTFHQSYSYEDFIEGFRPQENGNIELEDGIFKNICEKAINNVNKFYATEKLVFNDAFDLLAKEKIESENVVKINLKTDNSYFEIHDFNKKTIYYTRQGKSKNKKYHTLAISTLKQMYSEEENKIISGGLRNYYEPLLKELLKIGKESKIEKIEKQNFYIVIDEINRGNISKIFGELITLIEEDKRDKYEVTLPYSKEAFKIPSNLYIIATIDIALRRRFTFLKMKPNEELVKNQEAKEFMNKINTYIKSKLGEDYMLGHSYFMGEDIDLYFIKEYKIKPLLEEYFYTEEKSADKIIEEALQVKENN